MSKVYRYRDDAREIIRNVYKFCKEEKESGMVLSLARVWERTAALTGVTRTTAQKIVTEKADRKPHDHHHHHHHQQQQQPARKLTFDDFDKCVVRRTIAGMYSQQKVLPTLANTQTALRDSIGYAGSRDRLRKEIIKMKVSYSRCSINRRVLMERQDVVLSRIRYLRKIKDLRSTGHTIIYTDETYVHTNYAVPKCWQDSSTGLKVPFSKGERMIVLHAGYDAGFVPSADLVFKAHTSSGDYHNEMNHQNFTKWLSEKLIPNITANSVLVMDNAAYHNVQVDRCPTTATRKAQIQEWLTRHQIPFSQEMLKPELLELCKKHRQQPVFVVDEMLARHGHQALRLPPYHADLNPIELIWGNLKGYVARKNMAFNLTRIKELIQEGLTSITKEHWMSCIEHVKKIKQKYWESDIARDEIPEPIVINVADSKDDSETDTASETEDECI